MSDLTENLNPAQYAAVTAGMGPVLVLAGPGSGKTGVLTRRVAYLIQEVGIAQHRLMAVTFTNKAAGEMRERINHYLGERLRGLQIGTFHAICARILRTEHEATVYNQDYTIYDSDDQLSAVTQALSLANIDTKKYTPRRVLYAISAAKNEMQTAQNFYAKDYFGEIVSRVYPIYQNILVKSNAMDFDDLLLQMVLLLQNNEVIRQRYQERYEYILVDEFQDTNTVQYQLVKLLAAPQNNVFAVGDEDQSIYAFRGADYRNVLRFRQDFPESQVILLEQNYRSTQVVLDVARAVIDKNHNRTRKELFTERQGGNAVVIHEAYDDEYEARFIMEKIDELQRKAKYKFSDFAVMYRTNAQSRALEGACRNYGIPYTLVGGIGFYQRKEIKDILAYLRVVNNPNDRVSFARIINVPKRGIGDKSVQDFQKWAQDIGYTEALDLLRQGTTTPLSSRVSTLFSKFALQLGAWQNQTGIGNLVQLFDSIVGDIGYSIFLNEISDSKEQFIERSDNLRELRGLLAKYDEDEISLSDFLQDQQLMTDVDLVDTAATDAVTLLTLHAAKGLEYPVVFITGLEDGLLPHQRAFEEAEGLDEERRLFYVGITRAKDRLFLTYAFRRALYGGYGQQQTKSAFLLDIPATLVDGSSLAGGMAWDMDAQSYRQMTTWDGNSRLARDLRSQAPTPHVPDKDIVKKIVPFPNKPTTSSSSDKPLRFKTGMRVKHPIFGLGQVLTSKADGESELVDVLFEDKKYGFKKLDAEIANFQIL